jgi:hypothetical protein
MGSNDKINTDAHIHENGVPDNFFFQSRESLQVRLPAWWLSKTYLLSSTASMTHLV